MNRLQLVQGCRKWSCEMVFAFFQSNLRDRFKMLDTESSQSAFFRHPYFPLPAPRGQLFIYSRFKVSSTSLQICPSFECRSRGKTTRPLLRDRRAISGIKGIRRSRATLQVRVQSADPESRRMSVHPLVSSHADLVVSCSSLNNAYHIFSSGLSYGQERCRRKREIT